MTGNQIGLGLSLVALAPSRLKRNIEKGRTASALCRNIVYGTPERRARRLDEQIAPVRIKTWSARPSGWLKRSSQHHGKRGLRLLRRSWPMIRSPFRVGPRRDIMRIYGTVQSTTYRKFPRFSGDVH